MSTEVPPRPRPGGRSARVRAAVLAATLEELAADGYLGLSIEAVAGRAGVHKTTVYRRWPTKAALVAEALTEAGQESPVPDTGDVEADLVALALDVAARLADPVGGAVAVGLVHEAATSPEAGEVGRAFLGGRLEQADAVVAAAVARGDLAAGTDPRGVVEAVVGPLWFRRLVTADPVDAATARRAVALALDGARPGLTRRRAAPASRR